MWRIGFRLECIGLAAQRFPVVATLFILALSAFSVANLHRLSFDASVMSVLPDRSKAFTEFYAMRDKYRNFSRDITILVESERLATASGLEDLRSLHLDLALVDDVAHVVSIFSIPDFDSVSGESREWFPIEVTSDEAASRLIGDLIEKYPQVKSLYSTERKTAVIVASLMTDIEEDDAETFRAYENLRKEAEAIAPPDFKLHFTGLTPVGAAILSGLISDQTRLTLFGLLLGAGIAFAIFRSILASIVCAIPPALTTLWAIGLFSGLEIQINYLTTVLPTLALVLAFADGIFLYFRWQTICSQGEDPDRALSASIRKVGPATALTSITTAIAFLSFAYAESDALKDFAWIGASAVGLAFLAVIVGIPVVLHWAIRLRLADSVKKRTPMYQSIGRHARKLSIRHPILIASIGLAATLALAVVPGLVKPEYRLTDYLPRDSEVRYGEHLANEITGGRALFLVSVPFTEPGTFSSEANRRRLADVDGVLQELFPPSVVFSAQRVLEKLQTDEALRKVASLAEEAAADARTDFISKDSKSALIVVRLASDMSVSRVRLLADEIRQRLARFDWGQDVLISGFPVLMSMEFTRLIEQLRTSLTIAVFLGILIIGVATRSPFITLAAITPNLLPVLSVQFFLYLRGGTINLSEVVALTVAFGIAIDNAVHLINVFDAQKRLGKRTTHALSSAMDEVGPALTAGVVIICISISVTLISSLPVVPLLGQLIVSTLLVALFANLLILPANILSLKRLRERLARGEKNIGSYN